MLTVEYIEKNLRVEAIGAIVILSLIITAALSIVFLVFRRLRLWYWRVNDQVAALEKINRKLEELNQAIPNIKVRSDGISENSSKAEDIALAITPESSITVLEKQRDGSTLESGEQAPILTCDDKKNRYNVGKTEKIYNENELRQQIQF
jgi:L-2-hydroxyglutarate oxidase LhgO